jgi:hypothetical protein
VKRSEITEKLIDLMSPEDQRLFRPAVHQDDLTAPPYQPPPRSQVDLERVQQREFASWLTLEGYPFCWHRTDKKSTGTLGCPDFAVGVCGITMWIEFKRPGYRLSPDQEKFKEKLERQKIDYHLVYSADEAIKLIAAYRL